LDLPFVGPFALVAIPAIPDELRWEELENLQILIGAVTGVLRHLKLSIGTALNANNK